MIVLLQETAAVESLLRDRGIYETTIGILPETETSGIIYKKGLERLYIIKFSHEDHDDALICLQLLAATEGDMALAREWFFAFVDSATVIGGAGENIHA